MFWDSSTALALSDNEIQSDPKMGRASNKSFTPREEVHAVRNGFGVEVLGPANTERAPEGAQVSLCGGAWCAMLRAGMPAGQSVEIDQPVANT